VEADLVVEKGVSPYYEICDDFSKESSWRWAGDALQFENNCNLQRMEAKQC